MVGISSWKLDLEGNSEVLTTAPLHLLTFDVVAFSFYKRDPITLVFFV